MTPENRIPGSCTTSQYIDAVRRGDQMPDPNLTPKQEVRITAAEARALTEESLKNKLTVPILNLIYEIIRKTALRGMDSLHNPFEDIPPTMWDKGDRQAMERVIHEELQKGGFKVSHFSGDMRVRGYTTVSWRHYPGDIKEEIK